MTTHAITLSHGFEAAHRLPQLGGKCASLHGHSWRVSVAVTAPGLTDQATLVEFSAFKQAMRAWIDRHLDHGTLIGQDDPLVDVLRAAGKVFVFGENWTGSEWPTVEAIAAMLAAHAELWLADIPGAAQGARISNVHVTETPTNTASWVR